jgi:hypothetical protein
MSLIQFLTTIYLAINVFAQDPFITKDSCGPFELSIAQGTLQHLPNGTVVALEPNATNSSDNNRTSFHLQDNGVLAWTPGDYQTSCGFFDFSAYISFMMLCP